MTIKDLSKEELINFEEITLYNLLYGAIAEMQKEIPPKNNDSRSVVAVYGATIIPIKRRMAALNSLITKTNIDSMIFSGGFGWQGYQPRNITIEELKIEYKKPEVQKKILKRAKAIIENCPDVKGVFIKDVLGYTDENPETLSELIIDEMYQDEEFKKSMETLYNKYKENMSFYNWLTNYFETMSAIYIINKITESEIMQIIWNKEQEKKYNIKTILESNSFDTRDNARYSLEKFLERQKENPNLDTLIIVNEWPYLLRAVLTTRKIAKDMGIIGIKIIGYPANYSKNEEWYYDSIESFRTDKVIGTIENIRKLIEYDDSASFIIDKFIDSNKLYPGGPNITIGKDNISLIEAINNKIKKRIVTFN